jgi:hypothetical protein
MGLAKGAFAVLGSVMLASASQAALVAEYKFDNGSLASTGADATPIILTNGAVLGTPGYTGGVSGGPLTGDQGLDVASSNDLSSTQEFASSGAVRSAGVNAIAGSVTVSFWIRPNANTAAPLPAGTNGTNTANVYIFDKLSGSTTGGGFGLVVQSGTNFRLLATDAAGAAGANSNAGALTAGQWQQITVVNNAGTVTFYKGDAAGTFSSIGGGGLGKSFTANNRDLVFGTKADTQSGGSFLSGINDFDGLFDNIRVYDTALSAGDVQSLYSADLAAVAPVPEPAALGLLMAGGLLAFGRRRRGA